MPLTVLLLLGCRGQSPTKALPSLTDTGDSAVVDTGDTGDTGDVAYTPISPSTLTGPEAGAMLGWALAIGDRALWVSAPTAGGTGAIYRFPAEALDGTLTLKDSDLHLQGSAAGGLLGYGMATVDLDQDGIYDVAAGAPSEDGSRGAVYLLDGRGGAEPLRVSGSVPGGSFGVRIAPGPEAGTLLVAATDQGTGGVVHLLSGAGSRLASVSADEAGQQLGTGMAAGDLNGDGIGDVVLGGASEGTGSDDGAGVAGVFFGPLSGSQGLSDADVRLSGAQLQDHLGNRVASGEDLDGDGYDDLAVGAYWHSAEAQRGGAVYLFAGPVAEGAGLGDAHAVLLGDREYGYAGISVEMAPGVLVIGEYGAGAARIVSEPQAGIRLLSQAATHTLEDPPAVSYGYTTAVGDLDGGRAPDFVVGAYQADFVALHPGESL